MDADDGTFIMHYDDWTDNFSTLFLNNDFPEDWTGVRFKTAWTSSNSGGLPCKYIKEELERYAKNPQFLVKPVKDCEMMFSMSQTGGRLPSKKGAYFEYPFSETLLYANVAVFRLDEGERHLTSFDKDRIVFMSPIKCERENTGRVQLQAGSIYIIIPSTEKPGKEGVVYLSIYVNQYLRDVEIKRVFHPQSPNVRNEQVLPQLIPEEAEKLVNQTPQWKLELVKESLKYMVTDEDKGAVASSDSDKK